MRRDSQWEGSATVFKEYRTLYPGFYFPGYQHAWPERAGMPGRNKKASPAEISARHYVYYFGKRSLLPAVRCAESEMGIPIAYQA
jgi:hypothetical protein